jgi:Fe-S-cluster containining protein
MSEQQDQIVARLRVSLSGNDIELEIPVPKAEVTVTEILPVFRMLVDDFTRLAAAAAEGDGKGITCRKGCSACCRQMVLVSHPEARSLAALVNSFPEPRKLAVLERFRAARERMAKTNIPEQVVSGSFPSREALIDLGLRYFHLGIPCPFLEEDACSIYEHRPVKCREYLVTSPAEECSNPSPEAVHKVKNPGNAWKALAMIGWEYRERLPHWVPLTLSLEWAEVNPEQRTRRPARDLLRDFFKIFAERGVPDVREME